MCENVSYGYRKGQSGFGDYYICEERWTHKVPQRIPLKQAALIEPLSVSIHAVEKAGDIFGKSVAILGAGTIGAMTAAVCHAKGAGKIFLIDSNEFRLHLAGEGIAETICVNADVDPVTAIRTTTNGAGADVVLECTGAEVRIKQALEMTAKLGILVQVGINQNPINDYNYARILSQEITLKGSQGYCFNFEEALKMLDNGFDMSRYITATYPFERIGEAFSKIAEPRTHELKVVISYDG